MPHELVLKDEFGLLDLMMRDQTRQPAFYRPGPYWADKSRKAAREIRTCGIADFRGSSNLIGLSYADVLNVDIRNSMNRSVQARMGKAIMALYPLNKIMEAQIRLTNGFVLESFSYAQEIVDLKKEELKKLLGTFRMPESLLGGCQRKVSVDGKDVSILYLDVMKRHNAIASRVGFNGVRSVFEIGGGFGSNIHFLLENYSNIRKVVYLDIPPNLYVGTQYLKAHYGKSVVDYSVLRDREEIRFSADDNREILCIAPWQIDKLEGPVDIFLNCNSFVEMPRKTVEHYAVHIARVCDPVKSAVVLVTYSGFDLETTFHPDELPKFFGNCGFEFFEMETLMNSRHRMFFYVSSGKFSPGRAHEK